MGLNMSGISSHSSEQPREVHHHHHHGLSTRPNPNPRNFRMIVKFNEPGNPYMALIVRYPDATTYEGMKVLVVKGINPLSVNGLHELDPHFSERGPVVARFEPTGNGWEDAIEYVKRKGREDD